MERAAHRVQRDLEKLWCAPLLARQPRPWAASFGPTARVRLPSAVVQVPSAEEPLQRVLGSTVAGTRWGGPEDLGALLEAALNQGGPLGAPPLQDILRCTLRLPGLELDAKESRAIVELELEVGGRTEGGLARTLAAKLRAGLSLSEAELRVEGLDLLRWELIDYAGPRLVEVSGEVGLDLLRSPEKQEIWRRSFGSGRGTFEGGLTALDYDRDGYLDLLVTIRGSTFLLFQNDGQGGFRRVTPEGLLPPERAAAMYLYLDLDGDGIAELIGTEPILSKGKYRLPFYHFQGDRLVEVGPGIALDFGPYDRLVAVAAQDLDGDGDLDLFFSNHGLQRFDVAYNRVSAVDGAPSRLFRNDGHLRFHDATVELGLPLSTRRTIGATFVDYDGDGHRDLLLAHESAPPELYLAKLEPQGLKLVRGNLPPAFGPWKSVASLDADGDGNLDLYFLRVWSAPGLRLAALDAQLRPLLLSRAGGSSLFLSAPGGPARDRAAALGVDHSGWGEGALAVDLDNDGDAELWVTGGGSTSPDPSADTRVDASAYEWRQLIADLNAPPAKSGKISLEDARALAEAARAPTHFAGHQRDALFFNVGHASAFPNLGFALGLDAETDGRVLLAADFDGDGDQDLVRLSLDGLRFYENRAAPRHFLELSAAHPAHEAGVVGALVEVTTERGRQVAELIPSRGRSAAQPLELHVGLGDASTAEVKVRWPSGEVDTFPRVRADRRHRLVAGGDVEEVATPRSVPRLEEVAPKPGLDYPGQLVRVDGPTVVVPKNTDLSIVFVWSMECQPCRAAFAPLLALSRAGLNVILVSTDPDLDATARFAKDQKLTLPVYRADIALQGPTPRTYVFRGDRLLRAFRRPLSPAELAGLPVQFRTIPASKAEAELIAQRAVRDLEIGKIDDAAEALERALALDPSSVLAETNLAVAYGAKSEWDKAIAHGNSALRLRPQHLPAELNLAVAYSAKGDHPAAIPHYLRVIAAQPQNRSAQYNLAVAYAATKRTQEAKSLLQAWLARAPGDREAAALLERLEKP